MALPRRTSAPVIQWGCNGAQDERWGISATAPDPLTLPDPV
ncbi:hypothetical protein ACIGBL_33930 [Streptomyces sp. NPDC085614]